jgi:mRNA-degrading endonuclease RelE of RelBE toxin-antitoxin system/DNA-binding transcriptional regulator YiaG
MDAAARDLARLPPTAREMIEEGLAAYAATGRGDVKRLSGRDGYRLRLGSYRVLFAEDAVILAVYIGRRATTTYKRNWMMIPIKPQIIRSPAGEELVILSRAEFDALADAAAEALEEADDVAAFDERVAALRSGADAPLPGEVTAAMLRGDTLLRALRSWRNLTQQEIAKRTGLAQGFVSDLEKGVKTGSGQTLKALAEALDVDPRWLGVV